MADMKRARMPETVTIEEMQAHEQACRDAGRMVEAGFWRMNWRGMEIAKKLSATLPDADANHLAFLRASWMAGAIEVWKLIEWSPSPRLSGGNDDAQQRQRLADPEQPRLPVDDPARHRRHSLVLDCSHLTCCTPVARLYKLAPAEESQMSEPTPREDPPPPQVPVYTVRSDFNDSAGKAWHRGEHWHGTDAEVLLLIKQGLILAPTVTEDEAAPPVKVYTVLFDFNDSGGRLWHKGERWYGTDDEAVRHIKQGLLRDDTP